MGPAAAGLSAASAESAAAGVSAAGASSGSEAGSQTMIEVSSGAATSESPSASTTGSTAVASSAGGRPARCAAISSYRRISVSGSAGSSPACSASPARSCRRRNGPGAHQAASPSRASTAGTSNIRTTVASSTSAMIMPTPTKRIVVIVDSANAPVTTISRSAAALITRPVRVSPVLTASAVVAPLLRASTIRDSRNTS